jgi:diaminobutyrate-2-oxoglutarate transaminase
MMVSIDDAPALTGADLFEEYESNVRSYCRRFPAVFERARNAMVYAETGETYIDFFAGAGSLNYGHNNGYIRDQVLAYLAQDGVISGLDLHTTAKREFLDAFTRRVLQPRNLHYKVQFSGPTGANAVEAALKLARMATGRSNVFAFMGAYHGLSLGSLAVTANRGNRSAAGVSLDNTTFLPYPVMPGSSGSLSHLDTLDYAEMLLTDPHSGADAPAAVILETVQAEGGVMVAPTGWLRGLRDLCDRHGILLICDEIQTGCGRTGPFFSFERAGIVPDIVTVSKSISGLGLPMSLVLIRPDLDVWEPGQHTGTFRGNQLAFVGATAAIEYRLTSGLEDEVAQKSTLLEAMLRDGIESLSSGIEVRGIGMIWGIDFSGLGIGGMANRVSARCYQQGLIAETAGRDDSVLKLLPPLTTEVSTLEDGCRIIRESIRTELALDA